MGGVTLLLRKMQRLEEGWCSDYGTGSREWIGFGPSETYHIEWIVSSYFALRGSYQAFHTFNTIHAGRTPYNSTTATRCTVTAPGHLDIRYTYVGSKNGERSYLHTTCTYVGPVVRGSYRVLVSSIKIFLMGTVLSTYRTDARPYIERILSY